MKRNRLFIITFVILILIGSFLFIRYKDERLDKEGRYTLVTITDITGGKSGLRVFIRFVYLKDTIKTDYVDGTEMVGTSDIGKRYYIKFIPTSPKLAAQIIYKHPLDSLQAPPEGWKQLPNY